VASHGGRRVILIRHASEPTPMGQGARGAAIRPEDLERRSRNHARPRHHPCRT
jgi:hypothetical protein